MKRISLLFLSLIFYTLTYAVSYACYYDGYWSSWRNFSYGWEINGNWSGFVIYEKSEHPSNYMFRFQIDTSVLPQQETNYTSGRKETWYVYQGIVEYYVTEDCPTIKDVFKQYGFPIKRPLSYLSTPIVKRTARATIKTMKRPWNAKRHPQCYNFIFDDVAFGIDEL